MGFNQSFEQLFRTVYTKDKKVKLDEESVSEYSEGEFDTLIQVMQLCSQKGYRVKGGYAICQVIA